MAEGRSGYEFLGLFSLEVEDAWISGDRARCPGCFEWDTVDHADESAVLGRKISSGRSMGGLV